MSPDAGALIGALADTDTFRSWDSPPKPLDATVEYVEELSRAERRSGADESVLTGEALIGGHRVALIVSEFGFLAGSIGVAAADRIVAAIQRATSDRLPLVAAPASGGTRMQEGTPAFVRMAAITAALRAHKDAGLLYATYLRHPTTGGVMASWGSLGQITFAQPGALVGFLGPKVYRALHDDDFPPGVQTAENLYAVGLVDHLVSPEQLRWHLTVVLDILHRGRESQSAGHDGEAPVSTPPGVDAWEAVKATRTPGRPGLRELLSAVATEVLTLHGTGAGERDPSVQVALARIGSISCLVIGQDTTAQEAGHLMGPAGLRQAQRGMRIAAELGLPVVTVIDTPGAALSKQAEEGGLAAEIARCLETLSTHPSPTLALLLGQGCGGGALALLPCDRVLALERAWLSPLPPEGASVIRHGVPDQAADLARSQQITAADLHRNGIVHRVLPERDDLGFSDRQLAEILASELHSLTSRQACCGDEPHRCTADLPPPHAGPLAAGSNPRRGGCQPPDVRP